MHKLIDHAVLKITGHSHWTQGQSPTESSPLSLICRRSRALSLPHHHPDPRRHLLRRRIGQPSQNTRVEIAAATFPCSISLDFAQKSACSDLLATCCACLRHASFRSAWESGGTCVSSASDPNCHIGDWQTAYRAVQERARIDKRSAARAAQQLGQHGGLRGSWQQLAGHREERGAHAQHTFIRVCSSSFMHYLRRRRWPPGLCQPKWRLSPPSRRAR